MQALGKLAIAAPAEVNNIDWSKDPTLKSVVAGICKDLKSEGQHADPIPIDWAREVDLLQREQARSGRNVLTVTRARMGHNSLILAGYRAGDACKTSESHGLSMVLQPHWKNHFSPNQLDLFPSASGRPAKTFFQLSKSESFQKNVFLMIFDHAVFAHFCHFLAVGSNQLQRGWGTNALEQPH